ncbi:DUF5325 family protein [Alteribacillus sp. YIM 98480]|uniref:DUF5325 family protein n=1 Tax=Alteribacillus sp. YIM 98480 TaxID=2606599 RepID=UPI00131D6619|nr:DUF5325 family protein [Alteribacillus sp. YIM 98480]
MNWEKVCFLFLAVFATLCIASLGVAVAERSLLIAAFCLMGLYSTFLLSRKLRARAETN